MKSEIIIHNSVSLDNSLTGSKPDMGLHYKIAGDYKPDTHLIGSETIIKGNEMFGEGIVDEISLLVHPIMAGEKCYPMFSEVTADLKLKLKKSEQFENGCVWIVYSI
jgi:dihydrofolate reductase